MPLQKWPQKLWKHVELFEIKPIPRNHRIRLQTGLSLFASLVNRLVNLFELTVSGIRDDLWPSLIGFTKSDGIRVARATVSTQGLIRHLRNVRSSHYNQNSRGPDGIGHAVGPSHHSGHSANPHKPDVFLAYEMYQLLFVHWPRVAIDQEHLMLWRGKCLQQKHPEMRHEVAGHAGV